MPNSKKPSLQEALNKSASKKNIIENLEYQTSKKIIFQISSEAHLQIDQMKRDLRRSSMKELFLEALNDLFNKHGYPPIA